MDRTNTQSRVAQQAGVRTNCAHSGTASTATELQGLKKEQRINISRDGFARATAWLAGVSIVGASAYAVIATGHQDLPRGLLTSALAVGVVAGAAVIGTVLRDRRLVLAAVIVGSLVAGEGFNLLATADRIVTEREAAQAVVKVKVAAHDYASTEQAKAQVAHDNATRAKLSEAAKPGCKAVCAGMLNSAVVAASHDLKVARQRAEANPRPHVSGSALADRLGWAPWVLDLIVAGLLSVAANGLGAALVAFGAHGSDRKSVAPITPNAASSQTTPAAPQIQAVRPQNTPNATTRDKVLALITAAGGTVRGSQRGIASEIGVSPSRLNDVLGDLSRDGLVRVRAGSTGTVLQMA